MTIEKIEPAALSDATVAETTQKPEFYGFKINSSGQLIVETTGLGSDSIADTTVYKEYMINIQGITFQISGGNLQMVVN